MAPTSSSLLRSLWLLASLTAGAAQEQTCPDNVVRNGSADNPNRPLAGWGSLRAELGVGVEEDTGIHYFRSFHRKNVNAGPIQYLTVDGGCFDVVGEKLRFAASLRLLHGQGGVPYACYTTRRGRPDTCPVFSMRLLFDDPARTPLWFDGPDESNIAQHWNADGWNLYTSTFTVTQDMVDASQMYFLLRGPPVTSDLRVTGVELGRSIEAPSAGPTNAPSPAVMTENPTTSVPSMVPSLAPSADESFVPTPTALKAVVTAEPTNSPTGVTDSESPTSVTGSDSPTGVTESESPTGVTVTDLPTGVTVTTSPTGVTVTESPTGVTVTDSPTAMPVPYSYDTDSPTGVTVTGSPTNSPTAMPVPYPYDTDSPTAATVTDSPTATATVATTEVATMAQDFGSVRTESEEEECDMEVYDGDFENGEFGFAPWTVKGGGILSIVSPGFNSNNALQQTGRTSANMGPMHPLNIDCYVIGVQIEVSAKIKLSYAGGRRRRLEDNNNDTETVDYVCDPDDANGNNTCPLLTVETVYDDGASEHTILQYAPNDVTVPWEADQFYDFHAVFSVTEPMTLAVSSDFYFERPPPGVDMTVDDVEVRELSSPGTTEEGGATNNNTSVEEEENNSISVDEEEENNSTSVDKEDRGETITEDNEEENNSTSIEEENDETIFEENEENNKTGIEEESGESIEEEHDMSSEEINADYVEDDNDDNYSCDVLLPNGDAESGDTSGWSSRLGGQINIRSEGADATAYSFEHSGRTSFIMGPKAVLNNKCFAWGFKYTFDAKIKLLDEDGNPWACDKTHTWIDDESCPILTFQLTNGVGANSSSWEYYGNEDLRPWVADDWNSFHTNFIATKDIADAMEAYLYLERPRAGITIVFDEVVLSRVCSKVIINTDAENGSLDGWDVKNNAGGNVVIYPEGADGSAHSYGHFGRERIGGGPGCPIDMGCLVVGLSYKFTAKMMLLDENDGNKSIGCTKGSNWKDPDFCPLLSISMQDNNDNVKQLNFENDDPTTFEADKWNYYHAIVTVTEEMAASKHAYFMLKGVRAGVAILMDNVEMNVHREPDQNCNSLVADGDFESGTDSGWHRFHSGSIQIYPEGADGSNNSLLTVERSSYGSGPEYNLDASCLVEGVEYELNAKLKLLTQDGTAFECDRNAAYNTPLGCPYMGFRSYIANGSSNGAKFYYNQLPLLWKANEWNDFNVKFTVPHESGISSNALLYFLGAAPEIGIIVDKVTMKVYEPPTVNCNQLVVNNNAEHGVIDGWAARNSGFIGVVEGGDESDHAFINSHRNSLGSGPMQFIPEQCLVEGAKYDFYARFKLLDEDDSPIACDKTATWATEKTCPLVTFEGRMTNDSKVHTQASNLYGVEWVADDFNEYHAVVTITTAMAEAEKVAFFFIGPPAGVKIVFDNVSMKARIGGSAS